MRKNSDDELLQDEGFAVAVAIAALSDASRVDWYSA
jgi:hypothetical protein